jgi:hypothetical protein
MIKSTNRPSTCQVTATWMVRRAVFKQMPNPNVSDLENLTRITMQMQSTIIIIVPERHRVLHGAFVCHVKMNLARAV